MTDITEIQKLIAVKSKEPINKLLSYFILAKLNEGCSTYKIFIEKTHKDIFEDIYEDYKDDTDFKKFMVGWRCSHDELKLLIRIELYKHILKNNIKENKSHNKIITYKLTKKGQNYLQNDLRNYFIFESGRCQMLEVVHSNLNFDI
tara:strand:+ start:190 stop:627 length:438 start_codon:yes stop_codon:yes gene_type:complete